MNELWLSVVVGLTLGFAGSFHCLGMCGPLALMVPVRHGRQGPSVLSIFLYNVGRAVTYAIMGLLAGYVGSRFHWWGWQRGLSLMAGLLMLTFVLYRFRWPFRIRWIEAFQNRMQRELSTRMKTKVTYQSTFSIGLLNGWLPCGLVYVALPFALTTSHAGHGGLMMFSFGMGTWPVMMGLMWAGHRLTLPFRQKINRSIPYVSGVLAIVLILRGLNLGIPYVSPKMEAGKENIELCHDGKD